jgi:hypothetical protein
VRLRRSWFGGVAALVLIPSALLGGPETEMEPAGPPAAGRQGGPVLPGQPPAPAAPSTPEPGPAEPVPTPVPRAFAVRSPGPGRDHGMAG